MLPQWSPWEPRSNKIGRGLPPRSNLAGFVVVLKIVILEFVHVAFGSVMVNLFQKALACQFSRMIKRARLKKKTIFPRCHAFGREANLESMLTVGKK